MQSLGCSVTRKGMSAKYPLLRRDLGAKGAHRLGGVQHVLALQQAGDMGLDPAGDFADIGVIEGHVAQPDTEMHVL